MRPFSGGTLEAPAPKLDAQQGQQQWRGDGVTSPMADYIKKFRSYVEANRSGPGNR